jgi:hypothetical protein
MAAGDGALRRVDGFKLTVTLALLALIAACLFLPTLAPSLAFSPSSTPTATATTTVTGTASSTPRPTTAPTATSSPTITRPAATATATVATPGPAPTLAVPTIDGLPSGLTIGRVPLSGDAAPRARLRFLVDGQAAGEAVADADGQWTFDLALPAPGEYVLVVQALSDGGQVQAASEPVSIPILEAVEDCAAEQGMDRGDSWVVAACDTLAYISQQTGVPLQAILDANPLITDPDLIFPGQVIALPGRS